MASTLHISLPEPLKEFVESQTQAGSYASADEYVGDLLQREANRQRELEEHLLEALDDTREPLILTAAEVAEGNLVVRMRAHLAAHG